MEHSFFYYPLSNIVLSELFLTQCGGEPCAPGHTYGPAKRDHFLIHYIASGRGTFIKDSKSHSLSTGECFVIFPSETTTYVADQEAPWEYYWVGFSGAAARKLLESAGISPENPTFCILRPADEVVDCIRQIHINAALSYSGEVRALGFLLNFISMLLESSTDAKRHNNQIQTRYMEKAIWFVQQNYTHEITVDRMAKHIGIERSYLYRIFKSFLGVSPQEYILTTRLKRACQLLLETDMPITAISEATGFSTPSQMSSLFKRTQGVSPTQYRIRFRVTHYS